MLELLQLCLAAASALFAGFVVLLINRNRWVCNKRLKLIEERFEEFNDYMTYDEMFWRFWCWDIEAMKKPRRNENAQ